MVKTLLSLATIIVTVAVPSIASAKQFLCIAEMATGFKMKAGQWKSVDFNVDDDRFVIREYSDPLLSGQNTHAVFRLGKDGPIHNCTDSGLKDQWHLLCGGLGVGFVFVEKELRFQQYNGFGYVFGDDADSTPSITIGKCSSF